MRDRSGGFPKREREGVIPTAFLCGRRREGNMQTSKPPDA